MNGNDVQTVSKYDRLRGNLKDIADFTRPSTVQTLETITGKAETFVVTTARRSDYGDVIFIECIDDSQSVTRLALPPKVANVIAAQRDSLTARSRSRAAKNRAEGMTEEQKQAARDRLAKYRRSGKKGKRAKKQVA